MGRVMRSMVAAGMGLWTLGAVDAAELKMNWQGHDSDGVLVEELSVGGQATIEYRLVLVDGDTLSGLFFSNETVADVAQISAPASPANWQDGSTAGDSLGDGGQQVSYAAMNPINGALVGPGEFLIGIQTVELTGGSAGDEFEVTFSTSQLGVTTDTGMFFGFTATGSAFENEVGFFHIGIGSPGYRRAGIDDVREPLIIRVAQGSTGGGGGGGGGGGSGGNDNTNTNDNGDGGNDNTNDSGAGGNDNVNSNDNSGGNDNTNDNGAGGNDNVNSNDNSGGNDNTNDNGAGGNGNVNSNDNSGGNDNAGNDNSGDGGDGQPQGLCGLGMVSMLPLNMLGLFALRVRRLARLRGMVG